MKINNFQGDLSDISAKTATLVKGILARQHGCHCAKLSDTGSQLHNDSFWGVIMYFCIVTNHEEMPG